MVSPMRRQLLGGESASSFTLRLGTTKLRHINGKESNTDNDERYIEQDDDLQEDETDASDK
jgi:hypothetical protein